MPGLPHPIAVATRMDLPEVWRSGVLENEAGRALLPSLSKVRFGHGGHVVCRHTQTLAPLVRGDVARHQPEIRSQCLGLATGFEFGQLSHSMELAAQTAAGDGSSRPGSLGWNGGGGRDIYRRGTFWQTGTRRGRQSSGFDRGTSGWPGHWSYPTGARRKCQRGQLVPSSDRGCGCRQHDLHRRMEGLQRAERPGLQSRCNPFDVGFGGQSPAAGQPRRILVEALASWDAPRRCATESSGLLPGRIYVPLQSSNFRFARIAVLPTCRPSGPPAACAQPRIEGRTG